MSKGPSKFYIYEEEDSIMEEARPLDLSTTHSVKTLKRSYQDFTSDTSPMQTPQKTAPSQSTSGSINAPSPLPPPHIPQSPSIISFSGDPDPDAPDGRPPSPADTEIDPLAFWVPPKNNDERAQLLADEGIKVRDYAYDFTPKENFREPFTPRKHLVINDWYMRNPEKKRNYNGGKELWRLLKMGWIKMKDVADHWQREDYKRVVEYIFREDGGEPGEWVNMPDDVPPAMPQRVQDRFSRRYINLKIEEGDAPEAPFWGLSPLMDAIRERRAHSPPPSPPAPGAAVDPIAGSQPVPQAQPTPAPGPRVEPIPAPTPAPNPAPEPPQEGSEPRVKRQRTESPTRTSRISLQLWSRFKKRHALKRQNSRT
ncbi:hypothetical protein EWM64_g8766 [Hericium alpestre]|uniref:Uncharacterized protein n=1 Tax=Hericium alpestre TaxID=135208 RepID=A0A4Y9ZKB4_9AGAM|nr:hypothetical protein EWM64_g8766 [Hericium alpestre]